jgi:hypothetical protein
MPYSIKKWGKRNQIDKASPYNGSITATGFSPEMKRKSPNIIR